MAFVAGKTALVTGATDGIGKEVARRLLELGAKVVLHGRNTEKAARVVDELRRVTRSHRLALLVADLASISAVQWLVGQVRLEHPELTVLVNNAGTFSPRRRLTLDGIEQTYAVQYFAPFLLTTSLLDLLQANAPARVVNVTSVLHKGAELDLSDLRGERAYDGHAAYASSKLALVLFTYELAARLRGTGVAVNCVHPGGVATKLLRAAFGPGGIPVQRGADPVVRLAAFDEVAGITGHYFERQQEAQPDRRALDPAFRARLWMETERLLGEIAPRPTAPL